MKFMLTCHRDFKGITNVFDQHFEFAQSPTGDAQTRLDGFNSDRSIEKYNTPYYRYLNQRNILDIFKESNTILNGIFFENQTKFNRTKVNCDCKR